ncbi:YceD family protein [Methylocystis heyeri]|uniref:DUF177 domain-containing protein n=1 Tax=Methylocystis heyeri TaxID=391905 RepID=A0A6B8K8E3_9HYPH|nr:DUF177 domain-containing protein [Methylocystis heyeri]QGM44484.1 DUF177 domain-containing protein [Methylocystis heyeri]
MTRHPDEKPAPLPLSRPLQAASVPPEGLDVVIHANEPERAALARDNGLVAVNGLEARLHVSRFGAQGLEVSGQLRAGVVQTCVVGLEDFESTVEEAVQMRFAPTNAPEPESRQAGAQRGRHGDETGKRSRRGMPPIEDEAGGGHIVDIDADAPDPLIGGAIDLGAVVSEFLTLGLDPYPRRPGAVFEEPHRPDAEDNPFAALRRIATKTRDQ